MLVLHHRHSPSWFSNLNFDFEGVQHIIESFEGSSITMAEQIQIVSKARGIISVESDALALQIFLRPQSALFILSLNQDAMNPESHDKFTEAKDCNNRPGCLSVRLCMEYLLG